PELAYLTKIQEGLAASGYDPISTVNLGVPGNTSDQGVQRMDAEFAEISAYYCLVMFGTNDVARTRHFDADASGENLAFILTRARDVYGMFPVISTIPPQKDEQNGLPGIAFYQYGTRLINEKIIEIATENDIPYIDSFTAFYESEYDWEDLLEVVRGNHPSPLGHQVIADLFKEQILLVPPAAPTDFVVTDNSPTAKTVSWATNEEFDFSHYNVEFGYTATNLNRQITKTENEIKFMVFPLPTFYKPKIYYRIQAVDMDGNAGEFTETREIQF
ncbi:MAG: hypothetical protein GY757_61045, partial [bacterium]|nr:hypothetical protein [bacterium]